MNAPKKNVAPIRASAGAKLQEHAKFEGPHAWHRIKVARALQTPIFFALFFVCLWKWVEVGLIYYGAGVVRDFPVFFWGTEFARETLRYPGGAVEYLSALAAQSLFYSWFGALVLTAQACVIATCFHHSLRLLGGRRFALVAFTAPLLLLVLYSRYQHFTVQATTMAFVAFAAWLVLRFTSEDGWLRPAIVAIATAIMYAAAPAGVGTYVLLFVFCGLLRFRSWRTALVSLVTCLSVPYVEGVGLFGLGCSEAFQKLVPFQTDRIALADAFVLYALFLLLPVCCAAVLVRAKVSSWRQSRKAAEVKASASKEKVKSKDARKGTAAQSAHPTKARAHDQEGRAYSYWLETAGLAVAVLLVVFVAHRDQLKSYMVIDYYAWNRRWPEALAAAPSGASGAYIESAVAQAMYHTGRLGHELPQFTKADDLLLASEGVLSYWRKIDIYYDLGYVNMALHYLVEAMEFWGEKPILLQRLVLVNLALGNESTATLQLRALLKAPFFSRWAREQLEQLQMAGSRELDQEVTRLKSSMIKSDSVVRVAAGEELLALVAANPQNRMAFEYLMTYFLLEKNLDGFVKNLYRAHSFPGFELPPLWKEAVIAAALRPNRPAELKEVTLDPNDQRRLEEMLRVLRSCGGDKALARTKLKHEYETSYFYYYLLSP
jgi:hypothetical protein